MKTIICLWGLADIGKTSAIGAIHAKLNFSRNPPIKTAGNDFCAIVEFCGHKIGFASQGDPCSLQESWIDELLNASCEVIVCASRTKGQTVDTVEHRAHKNGYTLIWFSPFSSGDQISTETLNELTADAVIALIRKTISY